MNHLTEAETSAVPTPRRRLPWALLTALLLLGCTIAAAFWLAQAMGHLPKVDLIIDGEDVVRGLDPASLPPAHRLVLVALLLVTLITVVIVLPVALLGAALALLLVVLGSVGLPLLALALLAAVLLSPLWLAAWLMWRWLAGRSPASAPSPTMPA